MWGSLLPYSICRIAGNILPLRDQSGHPEIETGQQTGNRKGSPETKKA
jgi:hypothetical protein